MNFRKLYQKLPSGSTFAEEKQRNDLYGKYDTNNDGLNLIETKNLVLYKLKMKERIQLGELNEVRFV